MAKKQEWVGDTEVVEIALKIKEKYDEMFEHVDLSMIRFIRLMDKNSEKIVDVQATSFPYSIDNPYVFYFVTNNMKWKQMSEEQRNLAVFQAMFTLAPGSFDSESENYGKKRKKDVEDYGVVLGAAGGNFWWKQAGTIGIPNILSEDFAVTKDLDEEYDSETKSEEEANVEI